MNWQSFPTWTSPLRRHVVLLVESLRLANALERLRSEWTSRSLLLAMAMISLPAVVLLVLADRLATAVELLAEYWMLTAVVTAVYVASSVARRRRRVHDLHLQSWLITAPIPQASVRASQAIRTLLPTIAQFLGAALLILLVVLIAAESHQAGKVIAAIAAGLFVGAAVGWRASIHHSSERRPASRYVPSAQVRAGMQPSQQGLSGWPIAQVLAWSRPENSRYVLIAALFAVQGGSSAIGGLSVVVMYFIASYLGALSSALVHVAKSASAWLRSTPMALTEFVWVLSRRALIHQTLGTALAAVFLFLLGVPLMAALQIAALWLSLVISIWGCVLIDCYQGRSPAVKVALSLVVWGALVAVLQLRSAART